jgi:hypothetical protein
MKDWNSLAKAHGLPLQGAELERVTAPLAALEEVFRPLVAALPHEVEPVIILSEKAVDPA